MIERDEALAAIVARARDLRADLGNTERGALPRLLREHLARLEGALARLDAAEGRVSPHHQPRDAASAIDGTVDAATLAPSTPAPKRDTAPQGSLLL